jgi:SPOR domain
MKKPLLMLTFCCLLFRLLAQEVQINEDPAVAQLSNTWVSNNRAAPRISGWRVQIMSSTERMQVEQGRNKFRTQYPEIPAEWTLEKPYYKLRVGAFRSKHEALAFIAELSSWPGAYPAKDTNIHPRDFLEQ